MIMERGGRRRSRAADGYVPGHTVKNPYDCHRKMGRYRKEERIPEAFGAPFLRAFF